jgi:hypothetical protein
MSCKSSEAEDPVSLRNLSGPKVDEDPAGVERERLPERLAALSERISIVPGVGNEEDQSMEAAVALLQRGSTRLRLSVAEDRLGLHAHSVRTARDDGVPCTLIATGGQGDFSPPSQARVQIRAKALQQADMPRVSDRISAHIRPRTEVQSDRRAEARQLSERHGGVQTALDAADNGVVQAHAAPDVAQTQSGRDSCRAYLEPESRPEPPSHVDTAFDGPLSSRHVRGVWRAALTRQLPEGFGAGAAPSDRRAVGPRANSLEMGPSSVVWSPSRTNRPSSGDSPVAWCPSGTTAASAGPGGSVDGPA